MEEGTVTSQKPKNPGRVEWGRQLGKMPKERKLKKEKLEEPKTNNVDFIASENSKGFQINKQYGIGISVIILGLGGCYAYKRYVSYSVEEKHNKYNSTSDERKATNTREPQTIKENDQFPDF